ncbi:HAMP domain-containing protein [Alphaproteobacteria bacterium GH1-50]|uniref:histidine kinase n=1 Tax=Kangsaoukella pontilimi TaxID=2691042 RepID=A0A7C9J1C0_9RHOB|nr:HAMP domain-containing sensor histidine kinase [Kangsaoukella pontilimi]MXQ06721.1 HAMP domain-containing protein [Kangsaoukella pontilimi]
MRSISIRTSISLLLLPLALVMGLQSLERVSHLHNSARVFLDLGARVETTIQDIQRLSNATRRVELIEQDLLAAMDLAEIARIRADIDDVLGEISSVSRTLRSSDSTGAELGNRLAGLQLALTEQLDGYETAITLASRMADLKRALASDATRLRGLVLPFEADLLTSQRDGVGAGDDFERRFRFRMQMAALLDRIDDLGTAETAPHALEVLTDLGQILNGSVRALSRLPGTAAKGPIAEILGDIRVRVSGPDGLFQMTERMISVQAGARKSEAEVSVAIAAVGSVLARYGEASQTDIAEVYTKAASDARGQIFDEIILNAGIGLGIVLAVWLIFTKRISGRLERLTDEVLRIAKGDLAPLRIKAGNDELGRVTEALEVFRTNARELRRSNEDLAQFAYAASHDLRSPLRAISDLVEWTIEDHAEGLPEAALENLDLIRGRTDRLSQLLSDLLDYARAGATGYSATSVDLETMLIDIRDMLGDDHDVTLLFEGDQQVWVPETPVRTILLNLVSNAIKHHDRDAKMVRVTSRLMDNRLLLEVEDDGPGIPIQYQDQIFELFSTLQSRDRVEGSGLGLAMVERLIGQLDGQIELVSNPEQSRGSVFILRIPISPMPVDESRTPSIGEAAA